MNDPLSLMLNLDNLFLHSKALTPLRTESFVELKAIENLDQLQDYSEQDVREDIIAPILRVLGYQKESMFSIEREKTLKIAGKRLSIDYSMTLWEEDFWIIEAKKPSTTNGKFGYKQVWQALQYAVHPKINAALIVLCDGHALEIFDREESLEYPILRVERANLIRDFDKVRMLLSPLQTWFFQKRRVARLIDKVFDREFNVSRIKEFEKLIQQRLESKQRQATENMRALRQPDGDCSWIEKSEPATLIEAMLPRHLCWAELEAVSTRLIEQNSLKPFQIMFQIFPDHPRAITEIYFPNALHYLLRLEEKDAVISWLPSWLGGSSSRGKASNAIGRLINLGLTYFRDEPAWQIALLHSAGARRIIKALMTLYPEFSKVGKIRHLTQRFNGDEFSFAQLVSSPERHSLLAIDDFVHNATLRFLKSFSDPNGRLKLKSAKHELQKMWQEEIKLLESVENYTEILNERNPGEVFPTEMNAVRYDQLGHNTLCILDHFQKWKEYVLTNLRSELDILVSMGSYEARKWLEINADQVVPPSEAEYADRFFLGDTLVAAKLRDLYRLR